MRLLVSNDDGYTANGLAELVKICKKFGDVTVIAPKYPQSCMSTSISMGRPLAVKQVKDDPKERWFYMDATPASCVKYGLDELFDGALPDVVISGINHGLNAASAAIYSATLGCTKESALGDVPGIAVSIDNFDPEADMTVVREFLPGILEKLLKDLPKKFGTYYNINFPDIPAKEIKGIKLGTQGKVHWINEFQPVDEQKYGKPQGEEGEKFVVMAGVMAGDERNTEETDIIQLTQGYVTIAPLNVDCTDREEMNRLKNLF